MPRLDPSGMTGEPLGPVPDRLAVRCGNLVGPREDYQAGPAERSGRLAQEPAGEETAEAEGVGGVEQDDVQVAREPAVLEAVVEDEELRVKLLDRDPGDPDPVGVLEVRDVR